jgi:hypothetical protein
MANRRERRRERRGKRLPSIPVLACTTEQHEAMLAHAQALIEAGAGRHYLVRSPLRSTMVAKPSDMQEEAAVDKVASEMMRLGEADSRGIVHQRYLDADRRNLSPPITIKISGDDVEVGSRR